MFKQKSHANDSKKRFFEKCEKMNQNMQQRRGISSKAQQIPLTREGRFKLADVVYYIAACQIMQLEISALRNWIITFVATSDIGHLDLEKFNYTFMTVCHKQLNSTYNGGYCLAYLVQE